MSLRVRDECAIFDACKVTFEYVSSYVKSFGLWKMQIHVCYAGEDGIMAHQLLMAWRTVGHAAASGYQTRDFNVQFKPTGSIRCANEC